MTPRSWSVPLATLVVLLAGLVTAGAAAPVAAAPVADDGATAATASATAGVVVGAGGTALATPPDPSLTQGRFDRTEFVIRVNETGAATWVVRYKRGLANESERAEFAAFAERFESEETTLFEEFRTTASQLVAEGETVVGREMDAREFSRDARIEQNLAVEDTGVVEMRFTWVGFAETDAGRVVVGDVFEGGLYIGGNQELVVRHAPGLRFEAADPAGTHSGGTLAESDSVTWQGERSFSDNRPRVVLVPDEAGETTATPTATPTDATPTDTPTATTAGPTTRAGAAGGNGGGGDTMLLLAGGMLVLLVGSAAVVAMRRRQPDGGAAGEASHQDPPGPPGGTAAEGSAATDAAAADEAGGESGAAAPPEPRTDEELVLSLIEDAGGQMKQSAIVEETGWSKSKVSMVLSGMADDDEVTKLRVGRENLISLHGEEPAAARSPFEEDEE